MSKLLITLITGLLDKYVGRFISWAIKSIRSDKKKKKTEHQINKELTEVQRAVKLIKEKQKRGETPTKEDIKELKRASRSLSSGTFK